MKRVLFSVAVLLVLAASVRACPPLVGASFGGGCGSVATYQAATPFVATTNVFATPVFSQAGYGLGGGFGLGLGYGGVGIGVRHRGVGLGGVRKVGVRGRALARGRAVGVRGRGVGMRGKPAAKPARAIRRR